MKVLDGLAKQAERFATDVQSSLKRARIEGERRLLIRQHRTALEDLGERVYELVRSGQMPEGRLGPELAAVEGKLMEVDAKSAEIEDLRPADEDAPGQDPAAAAFPMVDDLGEPGDPAEPAAERGPGPGWEAASRYFREG